MSSTMPPSDDTPPEYPPPARAAVHPPADAATGKHKPRFRLRRKMPDSTAPAPKPEPSDEPTLEAATTTAEAAILPLSSLITAASHDPNLYDMYLNVQPWVPGVDRRFYGQFTAPAADPLQHTEGYNRAWSHLLHQRMVRLDRNRYGGVTSEDYTPLFERLWREHPLASHAMEHTRDIMHVCGTSYDTLPIVAVVIRQADLVRRQETFDTMAVCPGRDHVSQRVMATFELLTDTPETVYGMVRRAATAALGEVVQSILHEQWPDNAS